LHHIRLDLVYYLLHRSEFTPEHSPISFCPDCPCSQYHERAETFLSRIRRKNRKALIYGRFNLSKISRIKDATPDYVDYRTADEQVLNIFFRGVAENTIIIAGQSTLGQSISCQDPSADKNPGCNFAA
jgi:hypothetical protein